MSQLSDSRCARCVVPKSVIGGEFSPDGVCHTCRTEAPATEARATDAPSLEQVIDQVRERGRGRPYDCIIGLSGGRDSSYLAYLLRRKHNLRCLAAYYRTVFTPEITDQNVRRLAERLEIPLVEIGNISWDYHRKVARRYCLIWKKAPVMAIANLTCAPCKLVNRELLRIARQHDVRSLILGGNKFEEVSFLPTYQAGDTDTMAHSFPRQVKKLARVAGKGVSLVARHPSVLRHWMLAAKAALLYLTPFSAYLQARYPDILRVDYFFHAAWDEDEVNRVIHEELGWELPPDCVGTWKADCEFAEMKNYMFHKMHGATYLDGFLSNMIRAGELSREEALFMIENRPVYSAPRLQRVLKQLDLPPDFAN